MAKRKPIAVGIVGLGRAGWGMHVPELRKWEDEFRIAAGCDIAEDRRKRFAAAYPVPVYERIEDLIADPSVELVDIATRSPDHFAHAMMALRAGKHVNIEKPMCLTTSEAKRMQALAEKSPGNLYVRHNRRFDPDFLHVKEIIASGVLGDVYEAKLSRMGYARRDDWQTLVDCGGGQLLNWGPHIVDHATQLLGAPVAEMWSDLKLIAAVGDAEDHLVIKLKGANGRVIEVEISGGSALPQPEYVILGTKGAMTVQGGEIRLKYIDPKKKLPKRTANAGNPGEHFGTPEKLPWIEQTLPIKPSKTYNIWHEVYRSIRFGSRYPITLDEAVANMKILWDAKRRSEFAPRPEKAAKKSGRKK